MLLPSLHWPMLKLSSHGVCAAVLAYRHVPRALSAVRGSRLRMRACTSGMRFLLECKVQYLPDRANMPGALPYACSAHSHIHVA